MNNNVTNQEVFVFLQCKEAMMENFFDNNLKGDERKLLNFETPKKSRTEQVYLTELYSEKMIELKEKNKKEKSMKRKLINTNSFARRKLFYFENEFDTNVQ